MTDQTETPSLKKIAAATVLALLTAVLVLFAAVLPAEYGFDPLGTGEAFGLLALAQVQPIAPAEYEYLVDEAELVVRPSEWVEYTYRLDEGASMIYSWQATGPLNYNFHSAPDDAPAGYAESFDAQESDQAHGMYGAPFTGNHGWYFENLGDSSVTLTLYTAGFYTAAHEGRDRVSGYHDLADPRGDVVPRAQQ